MGPHSSHSLTPRLACGACYLHALLFARCTAPSLQYCRWHQAAVRLHSLSWFLPPHSGQVGGRCLHSHNRNQPANPSLSWSSSHTLRRSHIASRFSPLPEPRSKNSRLLISPTRRCVRDSRRHCRRERDVSLSACELSASARCALLSHRRCPRGTRRLATCCI